MASSSSEHADKAEEAGGGGGDCGEAPMPLIDGDQLSLCRGLKKAKKERACTAKDRISKMPPRTAGKRSSIYRGVTRHRWTGRYEAHLWDKSTWNQNQNKKGKQVYLGAYDDEEAAARAYDLAALKYWGPGTLLNFPVTDYTRDLEEMQNVSREHYLASLRRKGSGFSRAMSKYRPLSSRRDSQFGRVPGTDYINSGLCGAGEATAGSEYTGSYCTDMKLDLTNYIKWWGTYKSNQTDSRSKALHEAKLAEDIASELKGPEWSIQPTEPYEMPRLGVFSEKINQKTISVTSILLQSAAYKNLQEKTLKKKEKNENKNKNNIGKIGIGKTVEKSCHEDGNEKLGVPFGISRGLPIQRNVYPLTPLLSSLLLTDYNNIESITDPALWSSIVPALPAGPRTVEGCQFHAAYRK